MIPGISTGGGGFSGSSGVGGGDSASFGGIRFGGIPPIPSASMVAGYQHESAISWGVVLGGVAVLGVVYLAVKGR